MRAGQACSVVHFENPYASGHKKRPRGPRSTPIAELTGNLDAVPQPHLVDLKTTAIAYYLHCHLQTLKDATNITKGVPDDFLPIWNSRAECPMIDLAVSTMALAVFSRTQHHPPAAIEASIRYQRLLRITQTTLLSLDEGTIDAYLLASFFMSRYEDTVHRPSNINPRTSFVMTLQSFSHHDGALAILQTWKDQLSCSQPATDVIKHIRRGLIRSALLRNLALPKWIEEGFFFGERGLELEYDRIIVRTTNIRQRFSTLLKAKTDPQHTSHEVTPTAEELNEGTRELDEALQDWTARFPSAWCYQRHTLSDPYPWPMRDFYSPIVYSYSSLAYAAVRNQYYATRMLINSTRLRILDLISPNIDVLAYEQQRLECISHMKTMANDLASSVPFCLERFKVIDGPKSSSHKTSTTLNTNEEIKPYLASLTVWPLSIAASLRDVDVKQKPWFRSELARLGRIIGASVIERAETDQWLEL